jgi:hypothetical protein
MRIVWNEQRRDTVEEVSAIHSDVLKNSNLMARRR